LRGRDIKRYKAEFADLYVIIAKYGSYKYLPKKYPAIYNHLKSYEEKLKQRGQCRYSRNNKVNVKSDFPGQHHWLELDNNPKDKYLEEFEKEKIVYNDISQQLAFSLCKKGIYFNNTVYFITNSTYNRYFVSLLNTKLIDWYYKRTSAQLGEKAVRLFSIYVQNLPIPQITKEAQKPFELLVDTIIAKKETGEDTIAEEQKIDIMVYKLYDLTYDEVKIVDPEFGLTEEEYMNYEN